MTRGGDAVELVLLKSLRTCTSACCVAAYSVKELEGFLTEAGFEDVTHTPTTAERSIVTARKG